MVGKNEESSNFSADELKQLMSRLGDFPSAKIKLEDYFSEWIGLETTRRVITDALEDASSRTSTGPESSGSSTTASQDRIIVSASVAQQPPPRSPTKASPKKRSQEEMNNHADGAGAGTVTASGDYMAAGDEVNNLDSALNSIASMLGSDVSDADQDNVRRRANVDSIPIFYRPPPAGNANPDGTIPHRRSCYNDVGKLKATSVEVDADSLAKKINEIEVFFKPYPQGIPIEKFVHVTKRLCLFPSFFNLPLCKRINTLYGDEGPSVNIKSVGTKTNRQAAVGSGTKIKLKSFIKYWQMEMEPFDKSERFFRLVKAIDAPAICKDDFIPYVQELLHFHPGLDFLQQHEEFQRKYALTVITRIFYNINRSRTGRISLRELRLSNLMGEFMHVDEETDINKVTEYFSYEHFYVLYCRFFELDVDKDSKLSPDDLLKYSEHALSEAIVERVFQLGARAFSDGIDGGFATAAAVQGEEAVANAHVPGMTYPDFIYFMLSEEDKTSENSLRYWFSCCDLDSDGVITIDEMRYFYRIQLVRLMNLGQESVSFQDVLCQMLDMLCPDDPLNLTIKDFLRPNKVQLSGTIFDVLFNLHKFLRFEGRDPFQEKAKRDDPFKNDWDRFAYSEYHRLAAEEEAYDGGGDDTGITMDIDDNILMSDSNGAYNMRSYDEDGSDNYSGAKSGSNDGTDWYLDDDDDDESKQSGAKKTGSGSGRK